MNRLGALAIIVVSLVTHAVHADAPRLEKVDTGGQPLKLSVPLGWQVHTEAPRHRDLSTIAGMSPECPGADITVMIQLDQDLKTPADLLKGQYPGVKAKKLHGWDCVAAAVHTEAMCAGRVAGLAGIVGVYFATTDAAAYLRFGDPGEFTAQIAAGLSWQGKLEAQGDWRRDATADAKASCK